jgi:hypothetical protein
VIKARCGGGRCGPPVKQPFRSRKHLTYVPDQDGAPIRDVERVRLYMIRTCYEVKDGGRAIGWVVNAGGNPTVGPGAATVLLIRRPAAKSY